MKKKVNGYGLLILFGIMIILQLIDTILWEEQCATIDWKV